MSWDIHRNRNRVLPLRWLTWWTYWRWLRKLISFSKFVFGTRTLKFEEVFGRMVEQTDTGWLTVLEKNLLRLRTDILENYGIDSRYPWELWDWQWDRLVRVRPRWFQLVCELSRDEPFHFKKFEPWYDDVRERVENMLSSSQKPPALSVLLSHIHLCHICHKVVVLLWVVTFGVIELGVNLAYLGDQNLGRPSHFKLLGSWLWREVVWQNSRSDDHRTVVRIHVLSRVVSRLNSEICIPLFLGFDSGSNNKSSWENSTVKFFLPHQRSEKRCKAHYQAW